MSQYDYALIGGGLQNSLTALAIDQYQPNARVAMIETNRELSGNHTWSFHEQDVPEEARCWVSRLVECQWPSYQVRFPDHARTVNSCYSSILSTRFADAVHRVFENRGWTLRLGTAAEHWTSHEVRLTTGEVWSAKCVVDSRGPNHVTQGTGYQKFVGWEVLTDKAWPETIPLLMDATVAQEDGFHFLYVLPFSSHRVLVEDTYFSDSSTIDWAASRELIRNRLTEAVGGWQLIREESGVLPMPWQSHGLASTATITGGYAGGWFHPATGYSFPIALRLALALAQCPPEQACGQAAKLARRMTPRWQFSRLLNAMLFRLVPPSARWQIFSRLYRQLPASLLARFYACEFTPADALRMLIGRPPRIDLGRALQLGASACHTFLPSRIDQTKPPGWALSNNSC